MIYFHLNIYTSGFLRNWEAQICDTSVQHEHTYMLQFTEVNSWQIELYEQQEEQQKPNLSDEWMEQNE